MWKSLGLLAVGVLGGAAVVYFLPAPVPALDQPLIEPRLVAPEAVLSDEQVESARADRFASIRSVEDVLSLPTQFARNEALYVLAGRSDADQLQSLIHEGNRVDDKYVRDAMLGIFFGRLAEVDPPTALALARVEPYSRNETLENTIWRTWARNDLDEAIFEIKTQTNRRLQERAAQTLFAVYGYMNNETTDRIEAELGIEPGRQTRLRYLRSLLEESPIRVIEFINEESSGLRRREYTNWLVYAIDEEQVGAAEFWTTNFASVNDGRLFEQQLKERRARLNPMQTLQDALAARDLRPGGRFQNAMQELASSDLEAARAFYEQLDNPRAKTLALFTIVSEMAVAEPTAAFEWLAQKDVPQKVQLMASLLGRMAEVDPDGALQAASTLPGRQRNSAMSNVIGTVAMRDPERAMSMIGSLPDDGTARQVRQQVGRNWLMQDSRAAMEWLKTLPSDDASSIVQGSSYMLSVIEPDVATELLSFMQGEAKINSVHEFITQLAANGDLTSARSLVTEYSGEDGFEAASLDSAIISGLASYDPDGAMQLALQLQDEGRRDSAISGVVNNLANTDPARAAGLLSNIADVQLRNFSMQQVAMQWYHQVIMTSFSRRNPDQAGVVKQLRTWRY